MSPRQGINRRLLCIISPEKITNFADPSGSINKLDICRWCFMNFRWKIRLRPRRKKIPGPFEWKRLVRDTKGGPNPICLFRSGPTTANFHTDYISIDHYKLLLSASFHPQECSGMENFREESLKIKKFPSQTSQPPTLSSETWQGLENFFWSTR